MPRFYCPGPLAVGSDMPLPAAAARHVQVLRLQPGDALTLFNGQGGEYAATVVRMGRSDVEVHVSQHTAVEREVVTAVHLVVGMPANDRMDWLVEKACELGVATIQPLVTERSVLRLKGERADKRLAHWQAIAIAACEQSGRNRVPRIESVLGLTQWLTAVGAAGDTSVRAVLSFRSDSQPLGDLLRHRASALNPIWLVHGPEGGLSADEESRLIEAGFAPVGLGSAVLRAETAALAALVVATR